MRGAWRCRRAARQEVGVHMLPASCRACGPANAPRDGRAGDRALRRRVGIRRKNHRIGEGARRSSSGGALHVVVGPGAGDQSQRIARLPPAKSRRRRRRPNHASLLAWRAASIAARRSDPTRSVVFPFRSGEDAESRGRAQGASAHRARANPAQRATGRARLRGRVRAGQIGVRAAPCGSASASSGVSSDARSVYARKPEWA